MPLLFAVVVVGHDHDGSTRVVHPIAAPRCSKMLEAKTSTKVCATNTNETTTENRPDTGPTEAL
jgi:hypothetical protein